MSNDKKMITNTIWKRHEVNLPWSTLKTQPSICLEVLKKTSNYLSG